MDVDERGDKNNNNHSNKEKKTKEEGRKTRVPKEDRRGDMNYEQQG